VLIDEFVILFDFYATDIGMATNTARAVEVYEALKKLRLTILDFETNKEKIRGEGYFTLFGLLWGAYVWSGFYWSKKFEISFYIIEGFAIPLLFFFINLNNKIIDQKFQIKFFQKITPFKQDTAKVLESSFFEKSKFFNINEKITHLNKSIDEYYKKYENDILFNKIQPDWWSKRKSFELESDICNLFNDIGFDSYVTSKTADGGVDIVVNMPNHKLLIQSKGWSNPVGVAPIRELLGVCVSHSAREKRYIVGILVSVNGFTSGAYEFGLKNKIFLWDSRSLANIAKTGKVPFLEDSFKNSHINKSKINLINEIPIEGEIVVKKNFSDEKLWTIDSIASFLNSEGLRFSSIYFHGMKIHVESLEDSSIFWDFSCEADLRLWMSSRYG
jgi:HJR/Mrr/RecB family endonuclease